MTKEKSQKKDINKLKTLVVILDTETKEFRQLLLTEDESKLVGLFLRSLRAEKGYTLGKKLNLEEL